MLEEDCPQNQKKIGVGGSSNIKPTCGDQKREWNSEGSTSLRMQVHWASKRCESVGSMNKMEGYERRIQE